MRTALLLAALLLPLFGMESLAAERVDLILNEVQPRTVAWPVTTGVPFPRQKIASPGQCRLVDDTGTERLLQAKVAARWDGPTGSVRWLTIDFIAEPGRKYALEFGADVKREAIETPLRVVANRVQTGVIAIDFPKVGFCPANLVLGDLPAADGAYSSYLDHANRTADTQAGTNDVVVEETGPVRACIRVDRPFTRADGAKLVDCRARYHFYAGLGLIKVVHEIRFSHSTKDTRWQAFDFNLGLKLDPKTWRVAVDGSGADGNQIVRIDPTKETTQVASFQSVFRHYGNPECKAGISETRGAKETEHQSNEQVGEWMQVRDEKVAITGSMRWFTQQFPAEWQAAPDRLTLRLWSPRGGELDFGERGIRSFFGKAGDKHLMNWKGYKEPSSPIERYFYTAGQSVLKRGEADGLGVHKHHEFHLHFGPASKAAAGEEYGRLATRPPIALASGAWNAASDVMGPIVARPNGVQEEAVVDWIFDRGREMQHMFGDYGWWLFGAGPHYSYQWDPETKTYYADPRRFEFHTYQRDTQHWWNYLRSGERKFLDWALPSENHWVDIAVSHQPTKFHTQYRGGKENPAVLHWPRGDWAIDSTMHHLRHHDTAEAWLRGQSEFWATYHRTLETTTLAYYLTGDERFNDVIGYWKDYFGDLAGKTSDSKDFQPWHREQEWHRPTPPGEKPKSWTEMLRDYAPFNSGSRHQLTLLFNLSTLYEHTWDPKIRVAVKEYADAFLDPEHPIGVWRSQDNRAPNRAEAPTMAHFWTPALWRYARATNDPRMPQVREKFFKATLEADPFQSDVGIYSSTHIGYAYAFSKDPRHLRAARAELDELRPFSLPLAKPEDLAMRIYNPYAPVRSFTGVPRLAWTIEEAERMNVPIPPPAVTRLQRTPLAWKKTGNQEMRLSLWGFDEKLDLRGPDGKPVAGLNLKTTRCVSELQPFDRTLPGFAAFEHQVVLPKTAPAGWFMLVPTLEMAIIEIHGGEAAWCHAGEPVSIPPGGRWHWVVPEKLNELKIDVGTPQNFRILAQDGKPVNAKATATGWTVITEAGRALRFESTDRSEVWFRLGNVPAAHAWLASRPEQVKSVPPAPLRREEPKEAADSNYVDGRFGKAVLIRPGTILTLPDHEKVNGAVTKFFDARQGTLEFRVKALWDRRLRPTTNTRFIGNGVIDVAVPWKLPNREWAHVALVWRPHKTQPNETILHAYVDGFDHAYYRNIHWEGYGHQPLWLPKNGKWLERFTSEAAPGIAFAMDELRLSYVPRYADIQVEFGGRHTVNPLRFDPPQTPFRPDADTRLLFHFDGDLKNDAANGPPLEGKLIGK
jgi:hypothetical protein